MGSVHSVYVCALLLTTAFSTQAPAQEVDQAEDHQAGAQALGTGDPIIVYGRALEKIGSALSASEGTVGYSDFEDRPLSRVGELVENVPGVIATQHSGSGKANQFFLRGFNLDHGTDFAGFIDGVPINLRSHGHGQGYLDLNFIIPELVERIDYRKGPYFADVGDFSAAGSVNFETITTLASPMIEGTIGSFDYYRALAAAHAPVAGGDFLLALEGTATNGPWLLDEDLEKLNGLSKLTVGGGDRQLSLSLTGYRATWRSTDQVPERAVSSGLIDRLGFIDPDLGGRTTRFGLTANANLGPVKATAFAIDYDFGLTSNFTYFLDDPVNGDLFQQRDRRRVYGGSFAHSAPLFKDSALVALTFGGDFRYDDIGEVGLYDSTRGSITAIVREDKVQEFSAGGYAQAQFRLSPSFRATLGARADRYSYAVQSHLPINSGEGADAIVSPKAGLAWQPSKGLELYANYGEGFHSNDVRGAAISVDPRTGDPADRAPVLVRARGAEFGARAEGDGFAASATIFFLNLASELVFIGDAGGTEANAPSRRTGAEASLFWRPVAWLKLDGSAALTQARLQGVPVGEDRVPGAVSKVVALGAAVDVGPRVSASLKLRHFGAAPLIEDNSTRSEATSIVNLGVYHKGERLRVGVDVLNLLGSRDADISYFYASRLPGELPEGVEDRHLHPVEPRQVRVSAHLSL